MKIKFRAWEQQTKTMHYNLSFYNDDFKSVMGENRPLLNTIGLQFTGFLDKKGKEIYVGDICKGSWGRYKDADVVELDEIIYAGYEGTTGDLEVIGNIYENPELIDANNKP